MIDQNTKVVASFKEGGSTLCSLGKYESAKVKVTNGFTSDEKVLEIAPMRTIEEVKYASATRSIVFANEFVKSCLVRPKKPNSSANHNQWELYSQWNRISDERKIEIQLEEFAHDIKCELISFEII